MTTWRTRLTLMGMMVILSALLSLSLNSQRADASPAAQPPPPTDTPDIPDTPIPTEAPAPTDTPIPPATPQPTPSIPAPLLPEPKTGGGGGGGGGAPAGPSGTPVSNGCVKSIGEDGVSLSTDPGFYKPHIQIAPVGDILLVVQGPERVDNTQWWLLRTATGIEGWGNQDNVTPDPGPCTTKSLLDKALPQTGSGAEGRFFLAFMLVAVVIVVGIARRRLQAQAIATGGDRGNDAQDLKN